MGEHVRCFVVEHGPAIRSYKCSLFHKSKRLVAESQRIAFIPLLSGLVGLGRNVFVVGVVRGNLTTSAGSLHESCQIAVCFLPQLEGVVSVQNRPDRSGMNACSVEIGHFLEKCPIWRHS